MLPLVLLAEDVVCQHEEGAIVGRFATFGKEAAGTPVLASRVLNCLSPWRWHFKFVVSSSAAIIESPSSLPPLSRQPQHRHIIVAAGIVILIVISAFYHC